MTIQELEQLTAVDGYHDVRDQLKRHVYARSLRAFAAGDAARDAVRTQKEVETRQQAIRTGFLESLGGLPSMDTPLEEQTVGEIQEAGLRIEKVIFQSRPRNYVTANLYLPRNLQTPNPAVLFLCGHHREAKHASEYQIVCRYLAQAGFIVLAQDPIGQGERLGYYEPSLADSTIPWGTFEHDYAGAQCLPLGDCLARYFLHDAMRGVDYLCSRPEVDSNRIGVTGNSGGGTQTCLLMLGDPRIAAAAPTTFIMNRETYLLSGGPQDAEQIWPGFTARGFDHEDVLLAMVPRPVCVLAVTSDFFPIEGTRRTVERCKRFWEMFDRADRLALVEDVSTHAYTRPMARAAALFFARHLADREPELNESAIAPIEPERLWCTHSGQVRGELPGTLSVYEENVRRLEERTQTRRSIPAPQQQAQAREWLHERVYRDRQPCDLNPRFYYSPRMEELGVQACLWRSQEDLFCHGFAFRDFRHDGKTLPVTIGLWHGGTRCLRPHLDWIRRTCHTERAVLVLDVSGTGSLTPHYLPSRLGPEGFYGVLHKLATDLIWLDDDLAALRTYELLRAGEMIAQWPGLKAEDLRIYAPDRYRLYAHLAAFLEDPHRLDGRLTALLESRITQIAPTDGRENEVGWVGARYYDVSDIYSVILRGSLRYLDL